jgi:hypothetical protein
MKNETPSPTRTSPEPQWYPVVPREGRDPRERAHDDGRDAARTEEDRDPLHAGRLGRLDEEVLRHVVELRRLADARPERRRKLGAVDLHSFSPLTGV